MPVFSVGIRVAELEVSRVDVGEGELVLVGRRGARIELDPDEVVGVPDALRARVRRVEVESEYVSRKHCVLWVEAGRLRVRDLHSAQGTQVGVAGADTVTVESERVDVSLVSSSKVGVGQPERIDLGAVRGERDFVEAVQRAVREWARATGIQVSVVVEALEGQLGRTEDGSRLRLGNRHVLVVTRGSQTARVSFDMAREALGRYVAEQNAHFITVQQGAHRAAAAQPMVTSSVAMQTACWRVAQCAAHDLRVILLGETGVGKTLMARRYHEATGGGEFVTIDCTQYDDVTRLRAELFGAEPSAWPGLTRRYQGAFERGRDGTVFIDEIGELAPENQRQLLTFLDHGRFTRLLGTEELSSNARILCGTRQDLGLAVREGRFREDLWYRLAGMVIEIPPLRDRPEDIEAMLATREVVVGGEAVPATRALTAEAVDFLRGYPWPGNARELEMFCKRLPLFLAGGERADAARCEAVLRAGDPTPSGRRPVAPPSSQAPAHVTPPAPVPVPADDGVWRPPVRFDDGAPSLLAPVAWDGVVEAALLDHAAWRGFEVPEAAALRALFTQGDSPGAFKDFVERCLKPRLAARAMGLDHLQGGVPAVTAEHWKHALGFGDGTSVKLLLRAFTLLHRRRRLREALARAGVVRTPELLRRIGREEDADLLQRCLAAVERGDDVGAVLGA